MSRSKYFTEEFTCLFGTLAQSLVTHTSSQFLPSMSASWHRRDSKGVYIYRNFEGNKKPSTASVPSAFQYLFYSPTVEQCTFFIGHRPSGMASDITTPMLPTLPTTFTNFPNLPRELQLKIWKLGVSSPGIMQIRCIYPTLPSTLTQDQRCDAKSITPASEVEFDTVAQ